MRPGLTRHSRLPNIWLCVCAPLAELVMALLSVCGTRPGQRVWPSCAGAAVVRPYSGFDMTPRRGVVSISGYMVLRCIPSVLLKRNRVGRLGGSRFGPLSVASIAWASLGRARGPLMPHTMPGGHLYFLAVGRVRRCHLCATRSEQLWCARLYWKIFVSRLWPPVCSWPIRAPHAIVFRFGREFQSRGAGWTIQRPLEFR